MFRGFAFLVSFVFTAATPIFLAAHDGGANINISSVVGAARVYVADFNSGKVREFDASTGALNRTFGDGGVITTNAYPSVLAVSGNTLFVAKLGNETVGAYDAATGGAINARLITAPGEPSALASSGNTLFLATEGRRRHGWGGLFTGIGKYDATTGNAIKAHFIAGMSSDALAVSGNTLFVVNDSRVSTYDANTGDAINAHFITGMSSDALAVSGNTLFVVNDSRVSTYDATTGAAINANFITGLDWASDLAVSGNTLFVANAGGTVGAYDATTGATINARFITGLSFHGGLAVIAADVLPKRR